MWNKHKVGRFYLLVAMKYEVWPRSLLAGVGSVKCQISKIISFTISNYKTLYEQYHGEWGISTKTSSPNDTTFYYHYKSWDHILRRKRGKGFVQFSFRSYNLYIDNHSSSVLVSTHMVAHVCTGIRYLLKGSLHVHVMKLSERRNVRLSQLMYMKRNGMKISGCWEKSW